MNAKRDEEYKVLPRYLETTISSFRLVSSFLSWKETIAKLDGWNPYKERTIAKTLATIAKEKQDEIPKDKPNEFQYVQAKIPPKEEQSTIKERLRNYKIPKNQPSHNAAPAPRRPNNKRKRRYNNKNKIPSNQPRPKKRKLDQKEVVEEQEQE